MKTHETYLPTQQNSPQKNIRLSSSHEDLLRSENHQSTTTRRPKTTGRLTKASRLTKSFEFRRVAKEGKRSVGRFFCVDRRAGKIARLGISASCRYGSAPERNRFKRLVREAFRRNYAILPPLELNVIPRSYAKKASFQDIANELLNLLK